MLRHADAKELLRYDEDHSGQQMEQIEEEFVAPTIAQLGRWFPDETIGRMPFDAAVDGVTELREIQWIHLSGCAVYDLWLLQMTCAHIPSHNQGTVDHIVARDDIDDGIRLATHCTEDALDEAGEEAQMSRVGITHPTLHRMLQCAVN